MFAHFQNILSSWCNRFTFDGKTIFQNRPRFFRFETPIRVLSYIKRKTCRHSIAKKNSIGCFFYFNRIFWAKNSLFIRFKSVEFSLFTTKIIRIV